LVEQDATKKKMPRIMIYGRGEFLLKREWNRCGIKFILSSDQKIEGGHLYQESRGLLSRDIARMQKNVIAICLRRLAGSKVQRWLR